MDREEQIYGLMTDTFDLTNNPELQMHEIENEFASGAPCEVQYAVVFDAKCRLETRLGTEDDADVNLIIDSMMDIARHLALKMYDYGRRGL